MFHSRYRTPIILLAIALTLFLAGIGVAGAQSPTLPVPVLPETPDEYANLNLPAHYNTPQLIDIDNTPVDNPVTNEGATLGRVLFYDIRLSANNSTACASCHLQANGFTDPNALSQGFEGGLTGRNSMSLANARYFRSGAFFWDQRAPSLEAQTLRPIQDPVEMGLTLAELEAKVAAESYYPPLFEKAFGTPDVTSDRISRALAQFVRAMVSYQARYDQGRASNFSIFTPQENLGRQLFNGRGRCNVCHGTDAFVAPGARNNGLDLASTDTGLGGITGNPADNGKFKVPSLRNIALTGPYMHDGRFGTLAEVIDFYDAGVQPHPNLDPALRGPNGQPRRLNLTPGEKNALIAFLNTLTDQAFVTDPKFSDPFRYSLPDVVFLPLVIK